MNKLLELLKTKIGCGYVWGSQGQVLTQSSLNDLINIFGVEHYHLSDGTKAEKWLGLQVFDCSGLIVWGLQQLGFIKPSDDYNADMLYNQLCLKIEPIYLQQGDLVFRKNNTGEIVHVGIYSGNGKTIEAKGTSYGVIEGNVMDFNLFGRLKFPLNELGINDVINILSTTNTPDGKNIINSPDWWRVALNEDKVDSGNVKALMFNMVKYIKK